nr:hypothetical protein [Tanacetum cinerariifolium]
MMVQAPEDMGQGLEIPTDLHHTLIVTQPSSSLPHKKQKSRRKQRKEIKVPSPSSEIPNEERLSITSNDPLHSAKTTQTKEIASLKKRVKKLEQKRNSRTSGLKRLRKVGSARRVEFSTKASLGDQEDASKQGRMIDNLNQDGVKVVEKEVSTADPVTTASEVVTTSEPSETPSPNLIISSQKSSQAKDKGKGKMVEPKRPLKRKDRIMMDAKVAKNLEAQMQAELEKEERLARLKEEETNIALIESWDNTQAMMDADYELNCNTPKLGRSRIWDRGVLLHRSIT